LRSEHDGAFHWICEDRGANDRLTWADVRSGLSPAPHLLVLSHLSGGAHGIVARLARELPAKTALVWNPGTTQVARGVGSARPLLRRTDVLVLNRREIGEWFGGRQDRAALHRAVDALLRGGVSTVVVTEGRRGANAYERTNDRTRTTHVPSLAKRTVDTVGAGDAFVAGFSAEWIRTCDVRRALLAGSYNAAATIAVPGTLGGLLGQREMRSKLTSA
jgi:sugar/nucleoside kinase (ribokinase family)